MGIQRVGHNWVTFTSLHLFKDIRAYICVGYFWKDTQKTGNVVYFGLGVIAVQSLSVVQLFATPWTVAMPRFPVLHYLLEFTQTHVHWISDVIQPFHPLLPPSLLALNLSQYQGLWGNKEQGWSWLVFPSIQFYITEIHYHNSVLYSPKTSS